MHWMIVVACLLFCSPAFALDTLSPKATRLVTEAVTAEVPGYQPHPGELYVLIGHLDARTVLIALPRNAGLPWRRPRAVVTIHSRRADVVAFFGREDGGYALE